MSNTQTASTTETNATAAKPSMIAATMGNPAVRMVGSIVMALGTAAVTGIAAGYAINKKWGQSKAAAPAAAPVATPAGK